MVTIKDGKFYRDGEVMPVEFGNLEQIKALEDVELHKQALKEGLMLDWDSEIEVRYTADFKCFCGNRIDMEEESEQEERPDCLSGKTFKCRCKKHSFKTYMEYGCLMVKEVKR
jgi:hypothetical protein